MRKLVVRFVLLAAMIGSLMILSTDLAGEKTSAARFCCCECDILVQECEAGCIHGSGYFRCIQQCHNAIRDCQAMCDPICYDCQ
jgi:hypothetical protein